MTLPISSLKEIKNTNHWCGEGKRVASYVHRLVGKPKDITALDILEGLDKARTKDWWLSYFQERGIQAAIKLMDEKTANAVMERVKGEPRTKEYRWVYPRRNAETGRYERLPVSRNFPKKIKRGKQLWNLLKTVPYHRRLRVVIEGTKAANRT